MPCVGNKKNKKCKQDSNRFLYLIRRTVRNTGYWILLNMKVIEVKVIVRGYLGISVVFVFVGLFFIYFLLFACLCFVCLGFFVVVF